MREPLEALTESLGIKKNVRFLGAVPHDRVLSLMEDADLFVHCSENEGLPVAIMEAMASGLPVVASRVGGIPDIVHVTERPAFCFPLMTSRGMRAGLSTS